VAPDHEEEAEDASSRRGVARPAGEDPNARFYAAPGLSPQETTKRSRDGIGAFIERLAQDGRRQPELSAETVKRIHRALFGKLFTVGAGTFRGPGEDVAFPVRSIVGETLDIKVIRGAPPERLEATVNEACVVFNEAAAAFERAAGPPDVDRAAEALARLLTRVLLAHPFADGNHRVVYVLLQAGFLRLTGELLFLATHGREYEERFELALLGEQHAGPLVEFLAARVTEALA